MSFWAAARVRNESLAMACLRERNFEFFAPRIETRRSVALLFPMHIFVLVVAGRWHAVDCTPGIYKLIRFGDTPAKVPDAEIEALKARVDSIGVIRLPPPPPPLPKRKFAKGAKVKIIAGPFAGFSALHSGMTTRQRELVLLTILGATRTVGVPGHFVAAQ